MQEKRIGFNTGREYGPDGQPIVAKLIADADTNRQIYFHDKNRMITGKLIVPESCHFNQESIMRAYDKGMYDNVSFLEFMTIGTEVIPLLVEAIEEMYRAANGLYCLHNDSTYDEVHRAHDAFSEACNTYRAAIFRASLSTKEK